MKLNYSAVTLLLLNINEIYSFTSSTQTRLSLAPRIDMSLEAKKKKMSGAQKRKRRGAKQQYTPMDSAAATIIESNDGSIAENVVEMVYPTVNGWTADPTKFCADLPGALAPLGEFDPLGYTKDLPVQEIKRYRESEVMHGRVAMLATVG